MDLLTATDAAIALHVSRATFYRWTTEHDIRPALVLGREHYYDLTQLRRMERDRYRTGLRDIGRRPLARSA